ncbi:GerAB/ArcD/ProY family transporter [Paenibacillus sp. LPE1-1-1.1]|uniref:GerAB/ArcD/ProY family transporter n=1 Tax=Paenibacillus sp. LPE1-1-1.1 TaxID=3135230 RepID=UPI003430F276
MQGQWKEKISLWQLFVLTVIFEMGDAIVMNIGSDAKRDAWFAVFIASIPGFILLWIFHSLLSRFPGKNLFDIFEVSYGRIVTVGLTIAYSVYFFYLSAFVMRDFVDLMGVAILPNTPSEVIAIVMMFVVSYLLYLGLEVIARVAEVLFPYMVMFIFLLALLLLVIGEVDLRNVQPVLAEGIQPIMKAIFPTLLSFPIGEVTIILTVLMASTSHFSYARKVGMAALATGSFIIIFTVFLQISVMGFEARSRYPFPLMFISRLVSFAHFFERIDAVVVFLMMIGIMLKICVFNFIGLKGLEYVFRLPYRPFVVPMSMIVAFTSIVHAENIAELMVKGFKILPPYVHMPFQIYIPLLTFLVVRLKQRNRFPVRKRGSDE